VSELPNPAIARVLEVASRKGIALDIRIFDGAMRTPAEAAATVDAEVGQVVKPVLFVAPRPENRVVQVLCLMSGSADVDMRLLSAVTGENAIRPATDREIRELTGFAPGELPPVGYARNARVFMDQDLCPFQWVWSSAGSDRSLFRLTPGMLRMLANATVAPISAAPWVVAPMSRFGGMLEAPAGA
jgi:prolyl-tRNA editing enzyme YbaK/EbsC (Cys-tRNA(Pro) deacylase)